MNSAAKAFSSATLEIIDDKDGASNKSSNNIHETRAYYSDSSGRARVHLRVRLAIPAKDNKEGTSSDGGLQALIDCGCIQPSPVEANSSVELVSNEEKDKDDKDDWYTDTTCTFECTCISSSQIAEWSLEGVTILQSEIERSNTKIITALLFNIEVAVRGNGIIKLSDMKEMLEDGTLELCAVLRQKEKYRGVDDNADESANNNNVSSKKTALLGGKGAGIAAGSLGLEYGGGATSPSIISQGLGTSSDVVLHYGTQILRTPPLQIQVTLIPPLQLTVREVCGARAASGSTLVEITVEHSSKWHKEDVTVTGIAFHPGQSRLYTASMEGNMREDHQGDNESRTTAASSVTNVNKPLEGKSMQGGELSVLDMSRRVRWGFAAGSAPDLPLVLEPYEAFATVIQIDAGEDVRSRAFLSPISVNVMIGSDIDLGGNKENQEEKCGERIMVTADTRWTSSRVGVENSDAFRIDMSLRGGLETTCRVGAPIVISLRVLNLSMESRDLMLLMAKDGEGTDSGLQWERPIDGKRRRAGRRDSGQHLLHQSNINVPQTKENHSFNTAVVSEVNGYTFGVWGFSGDDDGTTRHHRDHELLAVDAALLLGEVKGQHSIEAELRFVPLREGTLDVPNLKLYDKRQQRWYNCVHTLKIVAKQSD